MSINATNKLSIAPATLGTTAATADVKIAGGHRGIVEGGCIPGPSIPKFPGDDFQLPQHPKCPPFPPFPPPGGTDPFYGLKLRGMSNEQLKTEKFTQQVKQLVAQFTGDTKGAADAQAKLNAIAKEEARRANGGGALHPLERAMFQHKLDQMNPAQLAREERKQMGALLMARLTGDTDGAKKAAEKLDMVKTEQRSRWTPWPGLPPIKPLPIDLPVHRAV
ncbi:MAG TPA: hypothetical protein VK447_05070 [Myxococcaceae bacterium]|nr:hypothetical protein [Myxococcaceae bacterium]